MICFSKVWPGAQRAAFRESPPDASLTKPSLRAASPGGARGAATTRNTLLLVYLGYLARYLSPLILVPFFARVLGAAEYGKVIAAFSLLNVVTLVITYGFPAIGTREVASAPKTSRQTLFGAHIKARLMLSIVGCAVGAVGTLLSPPLALDPRFGVAATLLGLLTAFNLAWYFQGLRQFWIQVTLESLGFASNIVFVLLLVRGSQDAFLVMMIFLATAAVQTFLAYAVAMRRIGRPLRFSGAIALIRASTPIFAAGGAVAAMANCSTLLLSLFASSAQVAFFGVSERLANLALGLLVPANQVLVPTVCRHLALRETAREGFRLMRRSVLVICCAGLLAAIVLSVLAPLVVPLLFGAEFRHAVPIVELFGVLLPFAFFNQVVGTVIMVPLRRERLLARFMLSGAVVNLALAFMLAPYFGGLGVAGARVISEVGVAAVLFLDLWRSGILEQLTRRAGA